MESLKRNQPSTSTSSSVEPSAKKIKNMDPVLKELNSIQIKKATNLKDLIMEKEYRILSAKKISTKFGDQILLELEDDIIFLPKRYNVMTQKVLKLLNDGIYAMKIVEVVGRTFNFEFFFASENIDDSIINIEDVFTSSEIDSGFGFYKEIAK